MKTCHRQKPTFVGERGSVTAEFAIVMPAIMGLVLVMLSAFSIQIQKFQMMQQAATAARAFARGEPVDLIENWFSANTEIELVESGQFVCANAIRKVKLLGLEAASIEIATQHCARESGL